MYNHFVFLAPLCRLPSGEVFFVRCDRSMQRAHCQIMDYFGWAVLQLWIQCFLVHCEYSWCNIRNDPINAIQQLFSCYSAAPLNVPVMCRDGFQIKGLQNKNKYSCKQLEYIKSRPCLLPFSPSYIVESYRVSMGKGKLIVLIQVVFMEPQALKLHKNFDHFKYSLYMNEKNINFGLNVKETIYTLTEQTCIEMTCIRMSLYQNDR